MSTPRFLCLAMATTATVLGSLVAAKELFDLPKPLVITLAVPFLIWSCVYWTLRHQSMRKAGPCIMELVLSWGLVTSLVLGTVYEIDRGGWQWFRLTGYDIALAEDFKSRVDLPLIEFVDRYPVFKIDGEAADQLILPRGDYTIDESIIVPKGTSLTIEPGTVVRFATGRSLISYMPIIANATDTDPILFTAKNEWLKWGTVAVVGAGASRFDHVTFEHGRRAFVNDVHFPGGLSIVDADVEIRNSQFLNMFGKDAVYVRSGHVLIEDNVFQSAPKDGLDLDGGSGQIVRNVFVNCDDEGIDLSDNLEIQAFDNQILDRRGGRFGAELNSEDYMKRNTFGFSDRG